MADTSTAWGLSDAEPAPRPTPRPAPGRRSASAGSQDERPAERAASVRSANTIDTAGTAKRLSPKVAAAAHGGIVWLHLGAIALWVGIAAILGVVSAAGRDVPAVVFVACLAAAAGHAVFLGLHALFAAAARRRQTQSQTPA